MRVVGVQVRDEDDVRMPSIRGRNWTPNSTEMAEARGQYRVEQNGSPVVLPRAAAVPPPCQAARHGTTYPPTHLELMRARARPTNQKASGATTKGGPTRGLIVELRGLEPLTSSNAMVAREAPATGCER